MTVTLQITLPTFEPIVSVSAQHRSIDERFEEFHELNPHVFEALKTLALDMVQQGVKRHSIKGLWEVLRWQSSYRTQGDDFKLNNDFTALYARKLADEVPELRGFFEFRRRRSGEEEHGTQ